MASFNLSSSPQKYPEGTSVSVYPVANWPAGVDEDAPPVGTASDTKTVTGGVAAFTGLLYGVEYVAYAQVGGQHRYVHFSIDTGISEEATSERVPYCWFQHSGAQSIPNDAWTTLAWDTHHNEEPAEGFTVAGQPTRIAYPVPGLYAAVVDVSFALNATGIRAVRFKQGGLFNVAQAQVPGAADAPGAFTQQHVQCAMQPAGFAAGDYFEIQVYQNSGGALDCNVDGLQSPSLMVAFIGAI
jgi:hypothetical protein